MRARIVVVTLAFAALLGGQSCDVASAHAGLVRTDPVTGAALGAAPTTVKLTFSERPDPSLSTITVRDKQGVAYQSGRVKTATGDALTLLQTLRPARHGIYTVTWRVVSAVDGHASSGTYAFGVGLSPARVAALAPEARTGSASTSLEVLGRWLLLAGLVALLGAATAGAARFGGTSGSDLVLAAAGWLVAVVGLLVLADAQKRSADASVSDLLDTSIGHALIHRALALGVAGAALIAARRMPHARRAALTVAALGALVAIVVHVNAGHAAAGTWSRAVAVGLQSAHFVAAGIWLGGLAALLLGLRGAASESRAAAVRRFSTVALGALLLVAVTGTVRAIEELSSLDQLISSGYGRAITAKILLFLAIVVLGARNRRHVSRAAANAQPLQRISRAELALGAGALVAAATLGSFAPPVSGARIGPQGLSDSGSDFATTARVRLRAASADPGPNRFTVTLADYDSGKPLRGARTSLRFTPLDDPGVDPTSLALRRQADGSYAGSGDNMSFDGRWGVAVLAQLPTTAIEVPLELDVPGSPEQLSVEQIPGRPVRFTTQGGPAGAVRITPVPLRPGPSRVLVELFDNIGDTLSTGPLVLTAAAGDGPVRQQPVRRLAVSRFQSVVDLRAGTEHLTVVARATNGTRLRAVFDIDVPKP